MVRPELTDWGKREYRRSDLGKLVRGKYVNRPLKAKRQAQHDKAQKAAKKRKAA